MIGETGRRTVPQISSVTTHVGCDDLTALDRAAASRPLLRGA